MGFLGKYLFVYFGFEFNTPFFFFSFPSFVGVAVDKDVPKDAEIPAQRRAGNSEAA